MEGFTFYKIYLPLHLHFTSSYNVMKYGGKLKTLTKESFERRQDKGIFCKWGNKFENQTKAGQVVLGNLIYNNDEFVYQDVQDAIDVYYEWKKVRESITEVVKNDCSGLAEHLKKLSFWKSFLERTPSGNTAPLLQLYQHKRIHPESLIALDSITPFIDKWETEYAIDPLISNRLFKLNKYKPFVKFDKDKVTSIFKGQIEENEQY